MTKQFNDETICFCEGHLYDREYVNTITSFFISFLGLYGVDSKAGNNTNILYSLL